MGKMILILLMGTGIIIGVIQINTNDSNFQITKNASEDYSKVQAKNISSSGIDIAFRHLSDDTTWAGVQNMSMNSGTVSIAVENYTSKYFNGTPNMIDNARLVTSVANFNGATDTARAVVKLPGMNSFRAPKFMRYSIASGSSINFGGNIEVKDDDNAQWNADVHTNQNFSMNGNNNIYGFLTYTGSASSSPAHRLNTNINPNQNPNNNPNHSQADAIDIPDIDPDQYISIAHNVHLGDVTYTGSTTLGTKDDPKIIYVAGDLTISGNFTGYGAFVVKGKVKTSGNLDITAIDPSGNNLGIYCAGDVAIQGGTVKAQILSNGNISIASNSQIYGGITAQGQVTFQGGASFFYRPITPELTAPFFENEPDVEVRASLISFFN